MPSIPSGGPETDAERNPGALTPRQLGRLFREHHGGALAAGLAAKQHRALVAGLCRAAAGFGRDDARLRAYLAQVLGPLLTEARGLRAFAAQSLSAAANPDAMFARSCTL